MKKEIYSMFTVRFDFFVKEELHFENINGTIFLYLYLVYKFHIFYESRSGEVYSIQHCVIKLVSDLRQVDGFLRVLHGITEILLKVALNTITITLFFAFPPTLNRKNRHF